MQLDTPEEKLSWIFSLFDADGGGEIEVIKCFGPNYIFIQVKELEEIVSAIFRFAGCVPTAAMVDKCVQDIRIVVDKVRMMVLTIRVGIISLGNRHFLCHFLVSFHSDLESK